MRDETARRIVDVGRGRGLDLEYRDSYSGRGMFGEETAAIVYATEADLLAGIIFVARLLPADAVDDFIGEIDGLRRDTLGLDRIAY